MDKSSRLGRFTAGERASGTSSIGSCVGLIGLDAPKKKKISNCCPDSEEKSIHRESFYVPRKNGSETSHVTANQNITSVECHISLDGVKNWDVS